MSDPIRMRYEMPEGLSWTRWDEAKQRVGNCRRMLQFAWLGLTTDSTLYAVVLVNSFRELGDGLISATLRDGTLIDPHEITKD